QAPAAARRALQAEARAVARSPDVALRGLLLRHRLRARALPFAAPNARNTLSARHRDAALATQWLADVIAASAGGDTARTAAWARRARRAMGLADLAVPAVTPRAVAPTLVRLQRLAALQRPLPVRAWVQAWADDTALATSDDAAAVLAAAAYLLDVPLPPALAACVPDLGAYWRSL
ncbi:hypothetical protein MOJ79_10090, partial [Calidifontimicrobium sp. SYSU G02091]|uniref:hypothetical protein n=1 Tax=Calidifontimicrobium sp. SYSU G02091 TaxID=2926421 RepID=UPI001F52DBE0